MTLLAPSAQCQGRKVVVVDADSRVLTAIDVALSPWSLSVGPMPGPLPEGNLDAASARARAIAAEQGAGAVVWIAKARGPDETGSLWVYDAQTRQLVVRPLTVAAPLNDAGAAAIALSVKTILRSSPLVEVDVPAPAVVLPPPTVPPVPVAPEQPAPPPVHETPSVWRLEAIVGARTPTGTETPAEPRAALGLSAWPLAFGGHFGLGAILQAGPGVPLDSAGSGRYQYHGQFREASFEASAHARAKAGRWLAFECQVGPALLLTSLDMDVFGTTTSDHDVRVNPTVNAGAIVDLALGPRLSFGALVDASILLDRQRYRLKSVVTIEEPPVDFLLGARLSVGVD
ncbi:MAG TPA: hypothetical protein VGY54_15150 [Polyangiaceae bacterium]|jgi:hypothetical protein|nr:hypothetical protein [Polyangiaceae bacterium]